jgi:hypothetical protein
VNYPKECSIFHNASMETSTERTIAADWGECLEEIIAVEKLHLLAVLSFWQATDTEQQSSSGIEFTLDEAIEAYPVQITSQDVHLLLWQLSQSVAETTFDLMVAVANQIKHGVYAE